MPQRLDQGEALGPLPGSLAYRLSCLFKLKRNPDTGKPYTYADAAARINQLHYRECVDALSAELRRAGYPEDEVLARAASFRSPRSLATGQYLNQLALGTKDNPSMAVLKHLATIFGIEPSYFFGDSEYSRKLDEELEVLKALANPAVLALARTAKDLSPQNLKKILAIVSSLADLENDRDPGAEPTT